MSRNRGHHENPILTLFLMSSVVRYESHSSAARGTWVGRLLTSVENAPSEFRQKLLIITYQNIFQFAFTCRGSQMKRFWLRCSPPSPPSCLLWSLNSSALLAFTISCTSRPQLWRYRMSAISRRTDVAGHWNFVVKGCVWEQI